jgi:hypothetical protein
MRGASKFVRVGTAAVLILLISAGLLAAFVSAEAIQKGGVRVSVTGKMTPATLPRSESAPVAVSIAGRIMATKAGTLPKLEKITVAINSNGRLQNKGIPVCRIRHISPSTTEQALEACGPSLVGEGHFSAAVKIPEQSPFPSGGKVLAFNGKLNGKPAILAHVYGTKPVPTSYVLPFMIKNMRGTYGTVLEAALPHVTGEWGYVTGVSLNLDRGFITASCPAPAGFSRATFPLLKASFGFGGGLDLVSTLTRNCKVSR